MQREMQGEEQPEGLNATEILMLHDPDGDRSLVILFFEKPTLPPRGGLVVGSRRRASPPGPLRAHLVHRRHRIAPRNGERGDRVGSGE